MMYRINKRTGEELSILGLGCMRFPKRGNSIIQEEAEQIMKAAVEAGVNYFDTAYIYGGSEICVGEFLSKGYRDKVKIATKLPHYLIKKPEDCDKYFEEQKKRLKTDHVEYYLMHMLSDIATWERLKTLGVDEWIRSKKESGEIENIGFSFHGNSSQFIPLLDSFDWDFCQIQYNYMDEYTQAGKEGLQYAYSKDIPVVIMEPLRGGRLVDGLPQTAKREFENFSVKHSAAEWGLRWIWNQPEPTVVLSGMSSVEQLKENVGIASDADAGKLTEEELGMIDRVKKAVNDSIKIPCTGCGYCMPCPAGVDIPMCFTAYNLKYTDKFGEALRNYVLCTQMKKVPTGATKCIKCGKCEKHCPQTLPIRDNLDKVKRELEGPFIRLGMWFARKFMKF